MDVFPEGCLFLKLPLLNAPREWEQAEEGKKYLQHGCEKTEG